MSWNALGTVTPQELGIWYPFSTPITGPGRPTIKVSCTNVRPSDRFLSFVWLRLRIADPETAAPIYTPAFRLYPIADTQIRELSLPSTLRAINEATWTPEIQKRITRRNLSGTTNEPLWGITLSQWIAEPVAPAFNPLRVDWRVEDLFDGYYLADVTVFNAGTEPIYEWAITFSSNGDITETWGAELEAMGANAWGLAPSIATGDPAIMPGETRTFTIRGEGNAPNLTNLTALVL